MGSKKTEDTKYIPSSITYYWHSWVTKNVSSNKVLIFLETLPGSESLAIFIKSFGKISFETPCIGASTYTFPPEKGNLNTIFQRSTIQLLLFSVGTTFGIAWYLSIKECPDSTDLEKFFQRPNIPTMDSYCSTTRPFITTFLVRKRTAVACVFDIYLGRK